jgi:hypothetical protein
MDNVINIKIEISHIDDMMYIGDLLFFDGPFLSVFANKENEPYIYRWVDSDKEYSRWLIFKTSHYYLQLYLKGNLSQHDLIQMASSFYFLVDIDKDYKHIMPHMENNKRMCKL